MSTQLATRNSGSALSIMDGQTEFTPAQVAVLQQLGVDQASREDLAVFFHQSVRTGLDPFAKQIYMIGRFDSRAKRMKQTIQTGIDGYRLIARRAADQHHETLGYADTLWCGEDGAWRDVWTSKESPAAAKVTVLRAGQSFSATALWNEYVQTNRDGAPSAMWARMSSTMLAKCAEALALRKAFPQDLSGIYTSDEMSQADNTVAPVQVVETAEPMDAAAEQVNRYRNHAEPAPEAPAPQVDWSAAFTAACGDHDKLTALRNQGKRAGLPATYGMFNAIEAELARLATETPVEGKLVDQ